MSRYSRRDQTFCRFCKTPHRRSNEIVYTHHAEQGVPKGRYLPNRTCCIEQCKVTVFLWCLHQACAKPAISQNFIQIFRKQIASKIKFSRTEPGGNFRSAQSGCIFYAIQQSAFSGTVIFIALEDYAMWFPCLNAKRTRSDQLVRIGI